MKLITSIFFYLGFIISSFSQVDTLEYGNQYELIGEVVIAKYEMPTGDFFETYILRIENPIFVNKNLEWESIPMTKEVHLNISNPEVVDFKGKIVKVRGTLFHSLTIHHRRDACIKVESININK
ncbi:MAG: DUF4431 domain-containing protein [Saprospiraceae bacterium]